MSALMFRTLALAGAVLLAGCERPPMDTAQQGFRGTAMQVTTNPRIEAAKKAAIPPLPADAPATDNSGPKAGQIYQNVKVLGDLSVAEFNRHMNAVTQWVSPKEGCNYCHVANNFADDSLYTKVVARRMIEMTRHLNADWQQHVKGTGVTCYTCHRGAPVPSKVWYQPLVPPKNKPGPMLGNDFGQNKATKEVGYTSLPYDPFSSYLKGQEEIKVYGKQALPQGIGNGATIQHAEKTYALMMHFSGSLGTNCTTCHNSQAFSGWIPKKVQAWHGIRMERDINNAYLEPLTGSFPSTRKGPNGDVAKVFCATCHQGVNKPMGGLEQAKLYIGLQGAPAAAALPAPLSEAGRSVLYFGVGSAELKADQAQGLVALIEALNQQPRSAAFVSGYHSAAGELAANQELAKQRAFAVRDALVAAGLKADRVKLDKPQQTEANVAGEDASARRVEVKLQ